MAENGLAPDAVFSLEKETSMGVRWEVEEMPLARDDVALRNKFT